MGLPGKLASGLERRYVLCTVLSPLSMLGEVLMETSIPLVMARIVDEGIGNSDLPKVLRLGLLMVSMSLFSLLCGVLCGRLSSVAAFGFSRNLRRKLFRKVQEFSFANMDSFGTGSLVTRLTTDVTNLQNLYQNLIRSAVRGPLMLVMGSVMAASINLQLACVFLVVIPVLACVILLIMSRVYPRFQLMFRKYDALNVIVQENLTAIRVVKAFVREKFEGEKFGSAAEELRDAQVRAEKLAILQGPLMQLVIYSCIAYILWTGGGMALSGKMMVGELISFLTYVTQVLMSLMMFSMMFVQFVLSRASVGRICEVLDERIDVVGKQGGETGVGLDSSVEFDSVSFSYPDSGNPALSGVSLKIPSGSTVGVIGATGSGKSTLANLVPRLYDASSGSVRVGGVDVRDWDLDALRRKVGFVLQNSVLFSGTVAENLRWGDEDATDEEVADAARASEAHSFVSSLPDGYGTVLGQGGVNLSGGQKQRLCIARALLKKPGVLILDDSTSAVDTATDSRIRLSLSRLLPGTTKIIISQRISSVRDCDFIVVMDDGMVDSIGTHSALLETSEIYREVHDSQTEDEQCRP